MFGSDFRFDDEKQNMCLFTTKVENIQQQKYNKIENRLRLLTNDKLI